MKFHLSDMLILEQLESGPKKPYRIIKGIMSKFEVDYKPSTGMIYPALDRLVKAGYVVKNSNEFSITSEGYNHIRENSEEYKKMTEIFLYNKLFFKNLRKSIKDMFAAIKEADRNYIESNQDIILKKISAITDEIKNHGGN